MIPCNSSLPKFALLTVTDNFSKIIAPCNDSKVTELQDKGPEDAVVIRTVFSCELSPHTMYHATLYLFSGNINGSNVQQVSNLFMSK